MPNPHDSEGTCSVSPNPVPNGSNYTIGGSGFTDQSGQELQLRIATAAGELLTGAVVDGSGNFSATVYASGVGAYTVTVEDPQAHGNKKELATCTFSVV